MKGYDINYYGEEGFDPPEVNLITLIVRTRQLASEWGYRTGLKETKDAVEQYVNAQYNGAALVTEHEAENIVASCTRILTGATGPKPKPPKFDDDIKNTILDALRQSFVHWGMGTEDLRSVQRSIDWINSL